LVQKSINPAALTFEEQFDPATGTAQFATTETFANADVNYPDFNTGIMYSGRVTDNTTAYAGFSVYHLSRPEEGFLRPTAGREIHRINRRYAGYLGGSFQLNENIVLYASGLYQQQAKAYEILTGAAVGFVLNPGYDQEFQRQTVLYLGGWYRYADAICPYVGLEMKKFTFGLSYDVNASSFSPATNGAGAYELSLTFNGCVNKPDRQPRYNFACPKF
jgi:type IX secretion system PorP/SprF family membrane protein